MVILFCTVAVSSSTWSKQSYLAFLYCSFINNETKNSFLLLFYFQHFRDDSRFLVTLGFQLPFAHLKRVLIFFGFSGSAVGQ